MKRTLTTLLAMAMVIALALPVFAVTDLTTAAVTKIDTPTSGNQLDYTATVGSDQYKLLNKNNDTFKNGITWYDCTAEEYVKTTHKAVAGHVYMVEVHLVPASGYTFSASATGSVNGNDIGEVAGGGEEIVLTYEFPACPYPSPVVFTSKSLFEVGGKATVDMLMTSNNVMGRGDIMADMYNAALEQNMTVVWICSTNSSLDKKGESVTWKAEDAGKEFVCRVGFYSDPACTNFIDYFDSDPFVVTGSKTEFKVLTTQLPTAIVGQKYSAQLKASEEDAEFEEDRYSQLSEFGLTLSKSGVISGTPTKTGNCHVNLIAKGQSGEATANLDITVTESTGEAPKILTEELPAAFVGVAYSFKLECSDGDAEFSEYYNPGKANDLGKTGLILTQHGELEGTPEKEGSYTFWIQAIGEGGEDYKAYTLTVKEETEPPQTTPATIPTTIPQTEPESADSPSSEATTAATQPQMPPVPKEEAFPWWGYAVIILGGVTAGIGMAFMLFKRKKNP